MNIGCLARFVDIPWCRLWSGVEQVVHDGGIEQHCVLRHNANVSPDTINFHVPEVMSVDLNRAVSNVVKPEEELQTRGLATSRLSHKGCFRARGDCEANIFDHRIAFLALVRKLDVSEGNLASRGREVDGILLVLDSRRLFELNCVSDHVKKAQPSALTKSRSLSASMRLF